MLARSQDFELPPDLRFVERNDCSSPGLIDPTLSNQPVRWQDPELSEIDEWREALGAATRTRPEAMRRLVEIGLEAKAAK